jgi:hypothetical protein
LGGGVVHESWLSHGELGAELPALRRVWCWGSAQTAPASLPASKGGPESQVKPTHELAARGSSALTALDSLPPSWPGW